MGTPFRLAVIVGSNREGRFAPNVAAWFHQQALERGDADVDFIDIDDIDLPSRFGGSGGAAMADFVQRVGAADAFVVITPEYNHSYPAALKQAIDFAHVEWQAKPVAFVSYGGVAGGLRAVEHLRNVFAELHAVTVRDSVSLHNYPLLFDQQGRLVDAGPVNAAAKTMLDSLGWWATSLKRARAEHAYGS